MVFDWFNYGHLNTYTHAHTIIDLHELDLPRTVVKRGTELTLYA